MMAFEFLVFAHRDAVKQIPSACHHEGENQHYQSHEKKMGASALDYKWKFPPRLLSQHSDSCSFALLWPGSLRFAIG
jgi:hypothetical protein